MTTKPKVLVGAPCSKVPVFDSFYDAFYTITVPNEDTDSMRHIGGCVPENLNKIVDHALRTNCSHVFIVEDDSQFERDTLMRLLAHDKPVVAGLCRQRGAPFRPYLYSGIADNGKLEWRPLLPTDSGLIGPADGLKATGLGGILIRMDVFDKLTRPYFWHTYIGEEYWGQDILFNKALIEAGVEVWCDTDVTIWHATQCTIGSKRAEDGTWRAIFKIDTAAFDATIQ